MQLTYNLSALLNFELNSQALNSLSWKNVGTGVELASLQRSGETRLVLYRIAGDAPDDAFKTHVHSGGESYLVLKGCIEDASGSYPVGSFVWLDPGSSHRPQARDETVVLVLWPAGVSL